MNARTAPDRTTTPLALLTLTLVLASCGGGSTPPGTPVTTLADSGAGSLREAIAAAAPGATLRLTQAGTLTLDSPLVADKNVTIIATGVTIDAAGKGRALEVTQDAAVTVRGGTLKGGVGAVLPASLNAASVGERFMPAQMHVRHTDRATRISAQAATPTVGGVLINHGVLTLDGVTVTGGKANLGGGIYNDAGATLTLKGTTNVTGNTADLIDPNDDTISQGLGGGIFTKGTMTMAGGNVSGNSATYSGGGIRGGVGSSITISGGRVDGNTCTLPFTGTTSADASGCGGGGIFTTGDLGITGGSVSNNTASYYGGGVAIAGTCTDAECATVYFPTFILSGGSVEGNTTTGTADNGGGGLWLYAKSTISGGTIYGNSSMYGGGIDTWHDLNLTGGVIEDNTATVNGGGLILLSDGANHIGGTARISGNTATNAGGGVYVTGASRLTMDGGSINGNKVTGTTDGGGGVRVSGSSAFTLAGGKISGNTAVKTGGGVTLGGQMVMTGGSITGNTVTNRTSGQDLGGGGGGVRMYAGSSLTASGGTISNNTAWYGGGVETGGAFQTSPAATFVLSGGTVSSNHADGNVGGGFFNGGVLTVQTGSVTGNSASAGGGVFNIKGATYAQTGGTVTGNTPDDVVNGQ
ncbi:hypothetical protein E7T09_14000 [Deinococcus sp. KSM4-11]|uniref:beta strand repeat-containing protein n=1 Tax=Deinococcus sp. KSM4-11 TaxID=2568654 RepID=UPI0010A2F14A|nr:hypothetical protein [Deinococcus sp. KSM4-11]THF86308.1 hypothetical protein E7T09_14000 [Deinococcus sp. KSM4-11]